VHHFLDLIKWKDENGLKKELRIYSKIGHRWKEIATRLGIELGQISAIERDCRETALCITAVLQRWFEHAAHLPNARDYTPSRGMD
jgi:hypothetical protein